MGLKETIRQFMRFAVVGAIGTAIDFGIYNILTRGLGWGALLCVSVLGDRGTAYFGGSDITGNIAACGLSGYPIIFPTAISVFLAILSNFFLQKYWAFKGRSEGNIAAQGVGFFVYNFFTYLLNQSLTGLFAAKFLILQQIFPRNVDNVAKVMAVAIVLFFNFFGSKFLIFRKKKTVEAV